MHVLAHLLHMHTLVWRSCSDHSGTGWNWIIDSSHIVPPVTITTSGTGTHTEKDEDDHDHPGEEREEVGRTKYIDIL